MRRLREELKVNTTCGASNISFGMPNRRALTGYFLAMAASHGMTTAIMNPLHDEDMHAIMARQCAERHRSQLPSLDRTSSAKCRRPRSYRSVGDGLPGASGEDADAAAGRARSGAGAADKELWPIPRATP